MHIETTRAPETDQTPPGRAADNGVVDDDVRIRPIREEDLDDLCRYLVEPEAGGEFEWVGFMDPKKWRRRWEEDGWLGPDDGRLAVDCSGAFAGDVNYTDRGHGATKRAIYEIGIALLPEFRGRGIGTTAQRLMVDYLFDVTPAHRLQAFTEVDNVAEQRALEKVGFVREGVLRATNHRGGAWRDTVLYALVRTRP